MLSEGPDGIPQLVTCIAGCGFRGCPERLSHCSSCWQVLQKDAKATSDDDAINHAFGKAGFNSLREAKLTLAFARKYGGEPPRAGEDTLPAEVKAWRTIFRPLTQYDEYPQRGTSACTYIACFAALWAHCKGSCSGEDWARCITMGVKTFHAAREADAAHCNGAVAPTTAAPHMQRMIAKEAHLGLPSDMPIFEETVLLLAAPQELGNDDAVIATGHCADFAFGKPGLKEYFRRELQDGMRVAVIVVRPPETYCVISNEDGSVALRDSHRRGQLDFDTLNDFLRWLEAERSIFAAAVACPLELNCVGLYRLISSRETTTAADDGFWTEEGTEDVSDEAMMKEEASYVVVAPQDVSVDVEIEQHNKRACLKESSSSRACTLPAANGDSGSEHRLSMALRRIADLEQEVSCLQMELARAKAATALANGYHKDSPPRLADRAEAGTNLQVASVNPYPPTAAVVPMEDNLPRLPAIRSSSSLPSSQRNVGGESRVMLAAHSAAISREKCELESDLQFVLARLPLPPSQEEASASDTGGSLGKQLKVSMHKNMQSMLTGRKKDANQGSVVNSGSAVSNAATDIPEFISPSKEVKEQWFTYLDNDGDGQLSQSDVLMGLCRLLQMEANPELIRPVRQLLTAMWEDWVLGPRDSVSDEGFVTKEAFLRANSGLADTLVANLKDHLFSTGLMTAPSSKVSKGQKSKAQHFSDIADANCTIC